jgi:hypothetical protein
MDHGCCVRGCWAGLSSVWWTHCRDEGYCLPLGWLGLSTTSQDVLRNEENTKVGVSPYSTSSSKKPSKSTARRIQRHDIYRPLPSSFQRDRSPSSRPTMLYTTISTDLYLRHLLLLFRPQPPLPLRIRNNLLIPQLRIMFKLGLLPICNSRRIDQNFENRQSLPAPLAPKGK